MIRRATLFAAFAAAVIVLGAPGGAAAAEPCNLTPRAECFGIESVAASLSTMEAGAHPDLTLDVQIKQDPESEPNVFDLKDSFSPTRHIRFNAPPGLIGDPNVLGVPQQCTVSELLSWNQVTGGCPNGSQIGISVVAAYELMAKFREPVFMMEPPGGDVVARVGLIAGIYPTFVDFRVRSEGDYGLVAEIRDAPAAARLIGAKSTFWGVPAAEAHDDERCTALEVFTKGCVVSEARPPGSRPLPFLTNPTRCGVPLSVGVNAASWADPQSPSGEPEFNPAEEVTHEFATITDCNRLPFGPSLTIEPTNHRAGAPTGLDITARLPASDGVKVLEPSQVRDLVVGLPEGMAINTGASDGLEVCSDDDVNLGERVAAECPDAAKLAEFEAEISALSRRIKGAIYLREPEPGNNFRFWAVADDLGAHVKLEGQLYVDEATGEIESVLLDLPQVPLREVKLVFKSGFRAPLLNPPTCGDYASFYEFTPWSGGPPVEAVSPIKIDEDCDGLGGFEPKLAAGSTNPSAGQHSPFVFTLTRRDGEQNIEGLDVTPPRGFVATFAGIPRCLGAAAESGQCPADSRIGRVVAAVGAGSNPLWIPQPGKRPTAVYLSGPYKGAPLSFVTVAPRQAGPFDFGDEVIRAAVRVDPNTAQATAHAEPLPQLIEGIPIRYRTIHIALDRPGFALNPTSCAAKATEATLTSPAGAVARPSAPFAAVNCDALGFKPSLFFRLRGGTRRGAHPSLKATVRPRPGDANFAAASVALPRSAFLDQAHIQTVCTRVQFAAHDCPAGSVYGQAEATLPLFDEVLSGPVYLRSSSNPLPDLVTALKGPDSLPVEANLVGRIDSINGGIRTTFDFVPDVPVTSFVLTMQGGKKGLLVNSTNLCAKVQRATAKFIAQNGVRRTLHPVVKAQCSKAKRQKARGTGSRTR